MSALVIRTGRHAGRRITLPADREVIVGREEGCTIRVPQKDVSRQHCILKSSGEGILLRDLDSQNGTFVNDQPIKGERLLSPGDVVRIGSTEFEVDGKKTAKSAPTPAATNEDDIVNWLAEDEGDQPAASGDTTIIPRTAASRMPSPDSLAASDTDTDLESDTSSETATSTPSDTDIPTRKKRFSSVAEEAADIIRRHWDSKNK